MLFEINAERTKTSQVAFIIKMYDGVDKEEIEVTTRWDGCTDLFYSSQSNHVCDLEKWIETLSQIHGLALQYFDGEFCVAPLRADEVAKKIAEIQGIIKAKFSEMETR
jgi:hypothetical protein